MADNESALLPSQRMRVAYILTLVGGYLDAYTYFMRGGVFANAQTGNIVKLGIAIANGTRALIPRYLVSILSFAIGLLLALAIQDWLRSRGIRLKRRSVLAVEMAGLAIVGLIPLGEDYNIAANCLVSFVAAMQYETFTTFRGEAIVTTMSTGNLRKMVDATYVGIVRRNREKLSRAGLYASIIITFTLGAYFGTLGCDLLGRASVVPIIMALGIVIAIITRLRHQNVSA